MKGPDKWDKWWQALLLFYFIFIYKLICYSQPFYQKFFIAGIMEDLIEAIVIRDIDRIDIIIERHFAEWIVFCFRIQDGFCQTVIGSA